MHRLTSSTIWSFHTRSLLRSRAKSGHVRHCQQRSFRTTANTTSPSTSDHVSSPEITSMLILPLIFLTVDEHRSSILSLVSLPPLGLSLDCLSDFPPGLEGCSKPLRQIPINSYADGLCCARTWNQPESPHLDCYWMCWDALSIGCIKGYSEIENYIRNTYKRTNIMKKFCL